PMPGLDADRLDRDLAAVAGGGIEPDGVARATVGLAAAVVPGLVDGPPGLRDRLLEPLGVGLVADLDRGLLRDVGEVGRDRVEDLREPLLPARLALLGVGHVADLGLELVAREVLAR